MQPSYSGVSRRIPDVEDYIDIVRRYKNWILVPLFAGLVIAVVGAYLWPDTFVSAATMQIVPQQVPERLVQSNLATAMAERLSQMQQAIVSRANLKALIETHNLYPDKRKSMSIDEVIDEMRPDIRINMIETPASLSMRLQSNDNRRFASAFQVAFAYHDAKTAQKVTQALVDGFLRYNQQVSQAQSQMTSTFIADELERAQQDLERLDREITQFRLNNSGRLPEQMGANVQSMNTLQIQLAGHQEAINRAQQEKIMVETNLQNLKAQISLLQSARQDPQMQAMQNDRLGAVNRAILDLETQLASALEIYKRGHPDIRGLETRLGVLKRQRAELEREEERAAKNASPVLSPQAQRSLEDLKGQIAVAQAQIKTRDIEIAERRKQMDDLAKRVQTFQNRVEVTPLNEQRYAVLNREYMLAKQRYEDLKLKRAASLTATNLEQRKAGETLEVLDAPSFPEDPAEPQRPLIAGIGLGLGLVIGAALAAVKEVKDTSLKNLKDVRAYTQLPVLTSVPLLEDDAVLRGRRRLVIAAWTVALLAGAAAMAASIAWYYNGRA